MNTSASPTNRRRTDCPVGERRASARLFLLRPSSTKPGLLLSPGPIGGVARRRYGSPEPGGSILITSAPKSDMTVAAAGPAIKLAQSITFKPSKTRSPILSLQAECATVARDPAGGSAGEMRADDQDRGIGEVGQHAAARQLRLDRIAVRGRRPIRAGYLSRMVHEIACDQRLLSLRCDPYADMARRMAEGRTETAFIADPVISLDEIDEPGVPNRHHRIREHGPHVFAFVPIGPMGELDAAHKVACVREGRDPATLDQHRVPTDVVDMEMGTDDGIDRLKR